MQLGFLYNTLSRCQTKYIVTHLMIPAENFFYHFVLKGWKIIFNNYGYHLHIGKMNKKVALIPRKHL